MKTPPLLLGLTLAFWGWQSGYLVVGLVLGALLEVSRITPRRLNLGHREYNRITDLASLIFLVLAGYRYAAGGGASVAVLAPLALYPLAAAQAFGPMDGVPYTALFYTARRKKARTGRPDSRTMDVTWPYLGLCLLGAAAANVRTNAFYIGAFLIVAAGLWTRRSRRFSPILTLVLLLVLGGAGFAGQSGLRKLHVWVDGQAGMWFENFFNQDRDPFGNVTSIGDVGRLKLSNRIVFRVEAPSWSAGGGLLREAAYNLYRSGRWLAQNSSFKPVRPGIDQTVWDLAPAEGDFDELTVAAYLSSGKGLLRLPAGAFRVENLPAGMVEHNRFGAVRAEDAPGLVRYRALFSPLVAAMDPPGPDDLALPDDLAAAFVALARKLELTADDPDLTAQKATVYFQDNFGYTLDLAADPAGGSPLLYFLNKSKAGHCEYFGTSAVMLLRAAGVPARYVTGYLVDEYSRLEGCFIVRARHAHAWAQYWQGGAWRDLDATPAVWVTLERESEPVWQPLADAWRWLWFKFSQWRWGDRSGFNSVYLLWLLIPALGWLAWRLRKQGLAAGEKREAKAARAGGRAAPSPFRRVEARMTELGHTRRPDQTLSAWLDQIDRSGDARVDASGLRPLLELHYRARFDPQGLDGPASENLEAGVAAWLKEQDARAVHVSNS